MLSSGYVQDLFPKEDLDGLLGGIRNEAKGAGYLDTPDQLFEYFVTKVKANLHVVLCFSPVSEMFRIRARKFPGLISCTTIDWFHPWPRDALIDVASRFLEAIEFTSDELRDSIALHMAEVHLSIDDANKQFLQIERRFNYTTPKSFLELIDFYKKLLGIKRGKVEADIEKLETGLDTLQIT
jgi:dynein heavy chain